MSQYQNFENIQDSYERSARCYNVTYYILNITIIFLQLIIIGVTLIVYADTYNKNTIAENIGNLIIILILIIDLFNRSDIFSQICGISNFSNININYDRENDEDPSDPIIILKRHEELSIIMSYYILCRAFCGSMLAITLNIYIKHSPLIFTILYLYNAIYTYIFIIIMMMQKYMLRANVQNITTNQHDLTVAGMRLSESM